jgi:hypothetical protein
MLKKHPHLKMPPEDYRIWRYMKWTRFEAILNSQRLFFARLFYLSDIDPYEGNFTLPMVQDFANGKTREEVRRSMAEVNESRKHVAVNCWHASDYESAAMRKQYSNREGCIAITTHVSRLAESFRHHDIYGAMVDYVDYRTAKVDLNNIVATAGIKRIEFAHEKEFRAVMVDQMPEWHAEPNGFLVPVDVDHLIEEVWLPPDAADDFDALVRRKLSVHMLHKPIKHSEILIGPNYVKEVLAKL